MTINPLCNIAQAVSIIQPNNETPKVLEKRGDPKLFSSSQTEKLSWKELTTWETLCKIETLMLEDELSKEVNVVQFKYLKNYCITVMKNEGGLLTYLKHFFQDGSVISSSGKASDILTRIDDILCRKKNKIPLVNYVPDFEYINTGSNGPSRTYSIKKEDHVDLSSAQKGIGFINGIQNPFSYAKENAQYLASLTGEEMEVDSKTLHPNESIASKILWLIPTFIYKPQDKEIIKGVHVKGVYNAAHGIFADLKESWYGLKGYNTKPARKVMKIWNKFFLKNPQGKFLMFCHSQGAIHVKHALSHYPEDLRKRIDVVAIAPCVYINPKHCGRVVHYVSKSDFIHHFDHKARRNVVDLTAHSNASFFLPDHSFQSPTFKACIRQNLEDFIRN